MRCEDTMASIRRVALSGLEELDIASAMYYSLYEITGNHKDFATSLLRLITYLLTIDVEYNVQGIGKTGFVYSNSYKNRKDHYAIFCSLERLFDDKTVFIPGKRRFYPRNLRYLIKVFRWFSSFHKAFGFHKAVYYTSMLLFGITNADYIYRILHKKVTKSVVVLSDMHLIDSLLVQRCNQNGIVTATLQHGNFETDEPFVLSKSNYFLAHGEYTKSKAVRYGMAPERIKTVGFPKLIGHCDLDNTMKAGLVKSVGLILSGHAYAECDTHMIRCVESYCSEHDIKVKIKLHPGYGKENYTGVEWDRIDEVYGGEISIEGFKDKIDLAVVLNSTVFIEYVLTLFPSLIYVDNDDTFIEGVSWCKFHSESDLEKLIDELTNNHEAFEKKMLELRTCFSETDHVAQNYKSIITEISGI
ncbi:MAG: hypothetical protein IKF90_02050 [Parasporobacterium sp.]|nr:hypothetical protein [Parasporobacterium sp.]